jgi:hypothetical protein
MAGMTEYAVVRGRLLLTKIGACVSGSASIICLYLVVCGCLGFWGVLLTIVFAVVAGVHVGLYRRLRAKLKTLTPDEGDGVTCESAKLQRDAKKSLFIAGLFTTSAVAFGWLYAQRHSSEILIVACVYAAVAMFRFAVYFRNKKTLKEMSAC